MTQGHQDSVLLGLRMVGPIHKELEQHLQSGDRSSDGND